MAAQVIEYKVEITVAAHVNAKIVIEGVKFPYIPASTPLWDELRKWMFDNKCLGRGSGSSGPSFFDANFTPEPAMLERWFEERGVQVQYIIDKDPADGSWTFDKNGKWVDDDPLNPMRVPPKLVEDLGNLRYDALQEFLSSLSLKLRLDSGHDRTRRRPLLSSHLEKSADKLLESAAAIGIAWVLCKPHMENNDGSGCTRRPDEDVRTSGDAGTVHATASGHGADRWEGVPQLCGRA
jgi:hypothetical protein